MLLPNNEHCTFFKKACGVSRFVWNWALAEWSRQYKAGEKPSAFGLKKQFNTIQKELFPWVGEVNSQAKQQSFADVGSAFSHFFRRVKKGEKPGYPKFKKKGKSRDSFYLANIEFKVDGHYVRLPKIGRVRMRESLRVSGKIMGARISREGARWYLSIQVEIAEPKPKFISENQTDAVGVDLGVKSLAVLSTGEFIDGPKAYAKNKDKLARLQRQLRPGKRKRGSRLYKAYQQRVSTLHRKIAGQRNNALHQLTAKLTQEHSLICIEDLNVKGMSSSAKGDVEKPGKMVKQKSGLNRAILDMGFYEFRRQLDYKSSITGSTLSVIDRWAPSSKTCSDCGGYKKDLTLADRTYTCSGCGLTIDRDINAAINICTLGARGINARGQDGSANC
ncbi:MAG: transposase [Flavobacteriales bacterium]|nr:transposase [Flavobacteriales bacterium]